MSRPQDARSRSAARASGPFWRCCSLRQGTWCPYRRLIDAVWDDEPPATARGQIQFCVSALRRRLDEVGAGDLIETRRPGYLLRVTGHHFDVNDFEARAREARAARVEADLARAMGLFRSALALWRGPAFADVDSPLVRQAVSRLRRAAAVRDRGVPRVRSGRR